MRKRRAIGPTLDQLARFDPVMSIVRELDCTALLDVGSGSRGFGALLDDSWTVTAVDTDFTDYGEVAAPGGDRIHRITADCRSLPFPDRSHDVVVSIDLLEHIPPEDRASVLSELARVARVRLVIACPVGDTALAADRNLAQYYRRRRLAQPTWLLEHLQNGFPDSTQIVDALAPFGRVLLQPNENIRARERLLRLQSHRAGNWVSLLAGAALRGGGGGSRVRGRLLRYLRGRDRTPTYRLIAVLDRS